MSNTQTVNARETVRLAYAFLLGREPESEAAVDWHLQNDGAGRPDALRRRFINSQEFISSLARAGISSARCATATEPLDGLLGEALTGMDGFFTDRFGVRTRIGYLPPTYETYSGKVGSADGTFDMELHEMEELNALLRSISTSKGQFAIMELGAGWGPWIVLGAQMARRRGLPTVLMGVEGSSDHVQFMHTHMADNGLDPASHHVVHAVVGTQDGSAHFPKLPNPSHEWGAEARFDLDPAGAAEMETVSCVSLPTLLHRMPVLDFLHCDVQGAEADLFDAAIKAVNHRVRRACVGTHSRAIEAKLLDLFAGQGWVLEAEKPCSFSQAATKLVLVADGVQVWRNLREL